MNHRQFLSIVPFAVLALVASLPSFAQKQIDKSFNGISTLYMIPAKGDCKIVRSNDSRVSVGLRTFYDTDPVPEYSLTQKGDTLIIKEASHPASTHGGMPKWTLHIPDNLKIILNTGAGSMDISGLKADLNGSTGKGDITVENCQGRMDLRTAKGNIWANQITLPGSSLFSTSSGEATVSLAASPGGDLEVTSGSGNVTVTFNGNEIRGNITMSFGKGGKVIAPFAFEKTDEIRENGNNNRWTRKSISIGNTGNRLLIGTGSGYAKLLK